MRALQLNLSPEDIAVLDKVYHSTKDVRLRNRIQMILLAAEHPLTATAIAAIVRQADQTVRNWLKRYQAEGLEGLSDMPRAGAPRNVSAAYREQVVAVVRQRPRSLAQSGATVFCLDLAAPGGLHDPTNWHSGLR